MGVAITRQVSYAIGDCLLTHLERRPIDVELARRQHAAYERLLEKLGYQVRVLPAEPLLPDSVFVEDAAVVLDEAAIITRPGAAARRSETASVAAALAPYRRLLAVDSPATLDGGDVLRSGRRLWAGLTGRTGEAGVEQLRALVSPLGYDVTAVAVRDCLHLKSAVSEVAEGTLLLNPTMVDRRPFAGLRLIEVDPTEPMAANALRAGDAVVMPAHHPRTRQRLEQRGLRVRPVEATELAKAEGGVSCCSLLVE
ncbi:MAG: dimethylarginine dimethylaminohydrolase family protein [Thermoanaerobaculia bacterium]